MKILILINSFGRGGAEKSTASFIIELKRRYNEFNFICVYLYPYSPGFYKELEDSDIELIHLKEKNIFSRVSKFRKIIKEFNPDIVHSVLFESNMISRLSSIGTNPKFVESLVNKPYLSEREFQNKNVKYKRFLIKWIDQNSSFLVDHFHSVGQAVANHYIKVFKRDFNYTVVHRGRPEPNTVLEIEKSSTDKIVLVTLARHEFQKGLIYLLEAVLMLKGKVKLQIVGRDGAATSILKEFVEKNHIQNDVEFCGYLSDINPVVKNADIYVSASLFEGLPGSVIEAMSLKKPLLLSDIEEHREVALEEENALFFSTKNPNMLVKQLEKYILRPSLINNYGERSYEIFQNKFTEEAMVRGMANFYRNINNNN
mgnify:CR=1 FL=1